MDALQRFGHIGPDVAGVARGNRVYAVPLSVFYTSETGVGIYTSRNLTDVAGVLPNAA